MFFVALTINTVKYWVLVYREIPSARQPYGTHQIRLDTFGNPEYSNYLIFNPFQTEFFSEKEMRQLVIYNWPLFKWAILQQWGYVIYGWKAYEIINIMEATL